LECGDLLPLFFFVSEQKTTNSQKASSKPSQSKSAAKNGDTFKKLRVMVLCHEDLVPPDSIDGLTPKEIAPFKTEWDVISTLKKMGHEVSPVGVYNNLGVIGNALIEYKPQVAFNLLEEFHGYPLYDQHVVSYLELMKQPYTGCNPRGLTISHDKALAKMVLAYHRIHVPAFAVFHMNRIVKRSKRLKFPLLVKSISEEGSVGIARASIVHDDEKLAERVEFIHRQTKTHAIAEQYIAGREIYVSVIGNQRLQTYTPWELVIEKLPEGAPNIATSKLKWDPAYQEKVGVVTKAAELDKKMAQKLERLSKRIYRTLFLSGYARLDYRVTDDGEIYLLEANPNPQIAHAEDFADSAQHSGVDYEALLQKIIGLGLRYRTGA
jgi:D-alanine-D-alanine ligase